MVAVGQESNEMLPPRLRGVAINLVTGSAIDIRDTLANIFGVKRLAARRRRGIPDDREIKLLCTGIVPSTIAGEIYNSLGRYGGLGLVALLFSCHLLRRLVET